MITSSDRPAFAISMTSWLENRLRSFVSSCAPGTYTVASKKRRAKPAMALRCAILIAVHPPRQIPRGGPGPERQGLYPRVVLVVHLPAVSLELGRRTIRF